MSWLLEILGSIFGAIFDLARQPKLRDRSEAKWFHYPLGATLLPVFISWKITVIATGFFMVSLMAGAVTEADDLRAQ